MGLNWEPKQLKNHYWLCNLSFSAFVCFQLYFEWLLSSVINEMLGRVKWKWYYEHFRIHQEIDIEPLPSAFQQGLGFDFYFNMKYVSSVYYSFPNVLCCLTDVRCPRTPVSRNNCSRPVQLRLNVKINVNHRGSCWNFFSARLEWTWDSTFLTSS